MQCPTVEVLIKGKKTIINESDYNSKIHTKPKAKAKPKPKAK